MNETQLYHLIPEPAGDWQEGDMRPSSLLGISYRLRQVKAQAGQLWRDLGPNQTRLPCGCVVDPEDDNKGPIYWNPYNKLVQCHKCGQAYYACPVPAQPCACEVQATPRTDAATFMAETQYGLKACVLAELPRQLEREAGFHQDCWNKLQAAKP